MKVISDINIVCIEQKIKKEYVNDSILIESRKNPYCFYLNEWELLSAFRGNWYQITPKKRELGIYSNEFFDLYSNKNRCYVITDETYINIDFIQNLIMFKESPIHKICFLIRLNYQKKHKISGVIKLKVFLEKLRNKKYCLILHI